MTMIVEATDMLAILVGIYCLDTGDMPDGVTREQITAAIVRNIANTMERNGFDPKTGKKFKGPSSVQ